MGRGATRNSVSCSAPPLSACRYQTPSLLRLICDGGARAFVHRKAEDVGARIMTDDIEIIISAHDLLQVDIGIEDRTEEHTYELQSLMRNTYAVICLNKKKTLNTKYS